MIKAPIKFLFIGSALGAIVAMNLATPASAQVASVTCPVGHEILIDNQCIDYKSGYIVLAQVKRATPQYTNANCRQGYEILIENQCIDFQTGYIELAAETAAGATQMTRK